MEFKDYYQIMGLSRDATPEEIKRTYRKLARKYHPDVSKEKNAEHRFKEIGEAYEVLKDPEKREAYNRLGSQWRAGQEFRPPPEWSAEFEFGNKGSKESGSFDFSEFFETLFGGEKYRAHERRSPFRGRGEDQHAKITLTLEEAFNGTQHGIQLQTQETDVNGKTTLKTRTLNVKIPAGVIQGQQIRLAGQGTPSVAGGENGDLYLEIELAPHRFYRVEQRDVYLNLPITPWEAALGSTIPIPTLGGPVDLKIPAGSQSGQQLRLKGRGFLGNPSGDHYVILQIITPEAPTEAARAFYRKMAQEFPFNPRTDLLKKS